MSLVAVNGACVDNYGCYNCICDLGFEFDGITCIDVNERDVDPNMNGNDLFPPSDKDSYALITTGAIAATVIPELSSSLVLLLLLLTMAFTIQVITVRE